MFYYQDITYGSTISDADPTGESTYQANNSPIRIWTPKQKYIVLGRSQNINQECLTSSIHKDKIPVIQRHSGGGTVLLSPQVVCFAFRFSRTQKQSIKQDLQKGSSFIALFLQQKMNLKVEQQGFSDLCLQNRKILGCSLRLIKDFSIYLAVLIVNPITDDLQRYLAHPSKEPHYRNQRNHAHFVSHLNASLSSQVNPSQLSFDLNHFIKKDWF